MHLLRLALPRPALLRAAARAASSAAASSAAPTTQAAVQYAPGKELSEAQVRRVGESDLSLRRAHDAIGVDAGSAAEALRKRLIFRSKQRGWCVASPWGARKGRAEAP